ncbi:MAG: hypothetical protein KAS94_02465, partial [Desulfobulbaceae bacterium]|nr:hypothetical protein [Desulfobulbaceae bacterium]
LICPFASRAYQDGNYNYQGPKPTVQTPVTQTITPKETNDQQRNNHGNEGIQTAFIVIFHNGHFCFLIGKGD